MAEAWIEFGQKLALLRDVELRYFPEWADRPAGDGEQREAERNSYTAGGYAEEFGHRVLPGGELVLARLWEEPEHSCEWGVQIGALHPGYPQCAKPCERFAGNEHREIPAPAERSRSRELHKVQDLRARPVHRDRGIGSGSSVLANIAAHWHEVRIRQRQLNEFL